MNELTIKQAAERSKKIREHYRSLEMKHHGSEWTVEEDAFGVSDRCGACGTLDDGAAGTLAGRWGEWCRFGAQNRRKHLVADGASGPDGHRQ